MEFGGTRGGGRLDVILVDTTWNSVDFLAYQLARRGLGVHAFTPFLRLPWYLRVGYPYRSHVELPLVKGSSDAFGAAGHGQADRPGVHHPGTAGALYRVWDRARFTPMGTFRCGAAARARRTVPFKSTVGGLSAGVYM